ncbi:MAG: hypothetical protein QW197_02790 [Candidatus Aenigmatarchaeota archaeon]
MREKFLPIMSFFSSFIIIFFIIYIYTNNIIFSNSTNPTLCSTQTEYREICDGDKIINQTRNCNIFCSNCDTKENCEIKCEDWKNYSYFDCNKLNRWDCKTNKIKWYIDYTCKVDNSGKAYCDINSYGNETYCGISYETDNGDDPYNFGIVIINRCEEGNCITERFVDECYGICNRSGLIEYWINSPDDYYPKTSLYPNLFSNSSYCYSGKIYRDKEGPSVTLESEPFTWKSSDISIKIKCVDSKISCERDLESGCNRYYIDLKRLI